MKILAELSYRYIPQVISLSEQLKLSHWSANNYLEELKRKDSRQFLAVDSKDKLIAFLIGRCYEFGEGEILNIGVLENYQRQGIADLLLNRFLQECEPPIVWLEARESNVAAIHFYQKHRFNSVGIRPNYYSAPTEHAILMKLLRE